MLDSHTGTAGTQSRPDRISYMMADGRPMSSGRTQSSRSGNSDSGW